jgi:hypothetical protein
VKPPRGKLRGILKRMAELSIAISPPSLKLRRALLAIHSRGKPRGILAKESKDPLPRLMIRVTTRLLAGIIFALIVQFASTALAAKAFLSDIVVTNTRDDLLVYFTVNNCFTPEMDRAIESGLNTTFTFFVKLFEKQDYRLDTKITDTELRHSIKYDSLKRVYQVTLSEEDNKVVTVRSFEEAKKLMAEVIALRVTPLSNLQKGGRYRLKMMAELDRIELPFYLHYVLFFLSLWDFETDWYSVDFRY